MDRRKEAKAIDKEREQIQKPGIRQVTQINKAIRMRLIKANGKNLKRILHSGDKQIINTLVDGMVLSHLTGMKRSQAIVKGKLRKGSPLALSAFNPYRAALAAIVKSVQGAKVKRLQSLYRPRAAASVKAAQDAMERALAKTIQESISRGDHVRNGVARIRKRLDELGFGFTNQFYYENLYRTELQLSYSAGRQQANQAPEIQEILWGYEYMPVGDNRTRPNHMALDGVKLPKDSKRWAEIMPPNGYSCRCVAIEVFNDEQPNKQSKVPKDGEPDKGWDFNPITLIQ